MKSRSEMAAFDAVTPEAKRERPEVLTAIARRVSALVWAAAVAEARGERDDDDDPYLAEAQGLLRRLTMDEVDCVLRMCRMWKCD